MTSIDPSRGPAAVARAAALRERSAVRSGEQAQSAAGSRGAGHVCPALQQRIAAISPEDPERPRKAVRLYLESELAREFGAGLLNDPGFPALLADVQQRMEEDAETAGAMEALAGVLLARRP